MLKLLFSKRFSEGGATMLEYALLASLLGVGLLASVSEMRKRTMLAFGDTACVLYHINTSYHGVRPHNGLNCPKHHCRAAINLRFYGSLTAAELESFRPNPNACQYRNDI